MGNGLLLTSNPVFILVAIIIAAGLTLLLYLKRDILTRKVKLFLAVLRFSILFILLFLLLKPVLKQNLRTTFKPVLVFGIDLSTSISKTLNEESFAKAIEGIQEKLPTENYEVFIRDLEGNVPETYELKERSTNLGKFFSSIEEEFAGQNLTDVILISDGIINAGFTPTSKAFPYRVHSIGVGDTTLKSDVAISSITANKLAYLGNEFPVKIGLRSQLQAGKNVKVVIEQNGVTVGEKSIQFSTVEDFKEIEFRLNAKEVGINRFEVKVSSLPNERSYTNNRRSFLIDVVDGREKVLILGASPHPDLKTFKSIFEENDLIEAEVMDFSTSTKEKILNSDFDLLILHQLPDKRGLSKDILPLLLQKKSPVFFIVGEQSNLSRLNGSQELLGINAMSGKSDKVVAFKNESFNEFILPNSFDELLQNLPPLDAPFGDYALNKNGKVLLFQTIGNLKTDRPLLTYATDLPRKVAILTAEGLWKWRFAEFNSTGTTSNIDALITKVIQILAIKESKEKLRVYPIKTPFDIDEEAVLETELYNNLFEKTFGSEVKLRISGPNSYLRDFQFTPQRESSTFKLQGLKEGVYSYVASANILGKLEETKGQFAVVVNNLEDLNTQADWNLLRTISKNTNGTFQPYDYRANVLSEIEKNSSKGKIVNREKYTDLIHTKWLLLLVLLLFTIEWVVRKYRGTY